MLHFLHEKRHGVGERVGGCEGRVLLSRLAVPRVSPVTPIVALIFTPLHAPLVENISLGGKEATIGMDPWPL